MTSRDKANRIIEKCQDDLSELKLHSAILTYDSKDGKMTFIDTILPRQIMIEMLKEVVSRLERDEEHESKHPSSKL